VASDQVQYAPLRVFGGSPIHPLPNKKMLAPLGGEIISSTRRSGSRLHLLVLRGIGGGRFYAWIGNILNVYQIFPIPGFKYINRFFTPLIYRVFVKLFPDKCEEHLPALHGFGECAAQVSCTEPEYPNVWLRKSGTVGKPGGIRRKRTSACSHGRPRSTRQPFPEGGAKYGRNHGRIMSFAKSNL